MYTANQLLDMVNSHIGELNFVRSPRGLYEPVTYVLSMGGKRLRPVLLMMAYNLYNDDFSAIWGPVTGIEVYHNHTLLHDDLMDRADRRRGKQTVHKKWSDNAAILSGDAMLILAYRYMSQCSEACRQQVLDLFTETALEICEGQQLDMEFEQRRNVCSTEYLEMIRLKTSVLLAASLKMGALLGGASPADADRLYQFGQNMGIAFQLKDDVLDVYGDAAVFGKNIGGDILCNKKTYLLVKALERADEEQEAELRKWLDATSFHSEEKIAAVTALYNQLNVREMCESDIVEFSRMALHCLDAVEVEPEKKQELKKLLDGMIIRNV